MRLSGTHHVAEALRLDVLPVPCYPVGVSLRPFAIPAVAVLGVGVYLVISVRRTPAAAPAKATPVTAAVAASEPAARPKPVMPIAPRLAAAVPGQSAAGSSAPSQRPAIDRLIQEHPNPQLRPVVDQADQAYDRHDYKAATALATKVLARDPNNRAMLRLMGATACRQGDAAKAQTYFDRLPPLDRMQMKAQCSRGNPGYTTVGENIKASLAHAQK